MTLGTILPTRKSLEAADRHAAKMEREKELIAKKTLAACVRRVVGGEVRYYATDERYAIIARDMKPRWFTVHADGDYYG